MPKLKCYFYTRQNIPTFYYNLKSSQQIEDLFFFGFVLVTNMSQNHLQFYHFTVPFIFLPKAPGVLFRLLPSAIWFYGIRTCGSPLVRSCRGQNKSSRVKWKYYQEVGGGRCATCNPSKTTKQDLKCCRWITMTTLCFGRFWGSLAPQLAGK